VSLPNFFIIGAPKSGTTSLQAYLSQHPEVYFSPYKEPNYFALAGEKLPRGGPAPPEVLFYLIHRHSVTDYSDYLKLFRGVNGEKAIGEASVRYLYFEKAPGRIKETVPNARFIAVLREPVSRLYSHYCMNVQYQIEPLDLMSAIDAEKSRIEANWGWDWHYVNVSRYAAQIKRYLSSFSPEQMKVFIYDDFVENPQKVFSEACRHLEIDPSFIPDMSDRGKVAYRAKNLVLDRWLHWPSKSRNIVEKLLPKRVRSRLFSLLEKSNSAPVPKLDPKSRGALMPLFAEDILELEEILGRKIPWNKKVG
jgi:hypothetical protein